MNAMRRVNLARYGKLLVALLGFAAMIVYAGGFLHRKTAPDALDVPAGVPIPDGARVVELSSSLRSPVIEVIGTTASERRVQVRPSLSATVTEVFAGAGDRVTANQPLVTLDDRELRQQLASAEAQLTRADSEFRRARQLLNRGATTEQVLTTAEAAFNSARADVERIKVLLTYTAISAPMDGIVTDRQADVGDLISLGQALMCVFDPQHMRLEAPVPVRLISKFTIGQEMKVTLDHPKKSYLAVVTEIVAEIDPLTRTQLIKLKLQDTDGDVLPGAFGRIQIEEDARSAIFIPVSAISRVGQLDFVMVEQEGRMLRRMVRTGREQDGSVEVFSGLSAGDRLIMPEGAE